MKKTLLIIATGVAILAASCKKDDPKPEEQTPQKDTTQTPTTPTDPTPTDPTKTPAQITAENKTKLESSGADFVKQMSDIQNTKFYSTMQTLSGLGSTLKSSGSHFPILKLFKNLSSKKGSISGTLKAMDDPESTVDLKEEFGKIAATYTWNHSKQDWDSTAAISANVLKISFPSIEGSSNNDAEIRIYDLGFTTTPAKNSLYTINNALTGCKAYLKVGGVSYMTYDLTASYTTDGIPASINTTLSVDKFSFNYNLAYSTSKFSSNYTFKSNSTTLMSQGVELNGTLTETKAKELEDYYGEDNDNQNASKVAEFVSAATVYYQIMDVKIVGSVDATNLTKAYDNMLDKDDDAAAVKALNDNCDLYAIFASNQSKIADAEVYMKSAENNQSKEPALMLTFPDNTKSDLGAYFSDPNNFVNMKDEISKAMGQNQQPE